MASFRFLGHIPLRKFRFARSILFALKSAHFQSNTSSFLTITINRHGNDIKASPISRFRSVTLVSFLPPFSLPSCVRLSIPISVGRSVDLCAKWTWPIYRWYGAEMNLLRRTALVPATPDPLVMFPVHFVAWSGLSDELGRSESQVSLSLSLSLSFSLSLYCHSFFEFVAIS